MSTQASIRVRCPHCQKVLSVAAALLGKTVKCPNPACRQALTLRAPAAHAKTVVPTLTPLPAAATPVRSDQLAGTPQPRGGGRRRLIVAGLTGCAFLLLGSVAVLAVGAFWYFSEPDPSRRAVRKDGVQQAQKSAEEQAPVAPRTPEQFPNKQRKDGVQQAQKPAEEQAPVAPGAPQAKEPPPPERPQVGSPASQPRGQREDESADAKAKREYTQFAEFASMEGCGLWTGFGAFDNTAPWRAKKLQSLRLTNPVLRKASDEFVQIAAKYQAAIRLRNTTNWTDAEMQETFKDLNLSNDDDFKKFMGRTARGTFDKVQNLKLATKLALEARVQHSQMWSRVLSAVTPAGGPDRDTFPIRVGAMWIRNVSAKPLTNLTVAIKTSASAELPDDACLHVVFIERLDPDEWTDLPGLLISKLWDNAQRTYKPGDHCFKCSIWSDQSHFQDVVFDLKALKPETTPGAGSANSVRVGCFPSSNFRGKYDLTTPWTSPTRSSLDPRISWKLGLLGGIWSGQEDSTKQEIHFKFMEIIGSRCTVAKSVRQKDGTLPIVCSFVGKIRDGKIDLEKQISSRKDDPESPPYWGTINGDRMELNYGKNRAKEGTISLYFIKRKPMVMSIDAKTEEEARKRATSRIPGAKIISVELRPDYTPYGKRWHITMEPK